MTLKLYMIPGSPPSRAVAITAKALGLSLELKEVNLTKSENKSEAFLKLNPTHTVPVLDDNGFILWESHAILSYLVDKYAKNDSLYPKDIKKRAIVQQRLHFDSGILFARVLLAIHQLIYEGKKFVDQDKLDALDEAYGFLEKFLESTQFIAGDSITIADYSLFTSTGAANVLLPIDLTKYPKLTAWLKKAETLPIADIYKEGVTLLNDFVQILLKK